MRCSNYVKILILEAHNFACHSHIHTRSTPECSSFDLQIMFTQCALSKYSDEQPGLWAQKTNMSRFRLLCTKSSPASFKAQTEEIPESEALRLASVLQHPAPKKQCGGAVRWYRKPCQPGTRPQQRSPADYHLRTHVRRRREYGSVLLAMHAFTTKSTSMEWSACRRGRSNCPPDPLRNIFGTPVKALLRAAPALSKLPFQGLTCP